MAEICCGARIGATPRERAPVVKIVESKFVVPSMRVSEQNKHLPELIALGVLDHVTAPQMLIRMPFIFAQTLDWELMTQSLSAMLSRYPLFAGRLVTSLKNTTKSGTGGGGGSAGRYQVSLCNRGASLTLATCESPLEHILPAELLSSIHTSGQSFLYSAPDLSSFLPAIPSSIQGYCNRDDVPLLHAQITHLRGGGAVLAVVLPHLIADQETCRLVLKAWAEDYTTACVAAEMELNSNGPIRMLSAIFDEESGELSVSNSDEDSLEQDSDSTGTDVANDNYYSDYITEESSEEYLGSTNAVTNTTNSTSFLHSGHALEAHAAPALPPNWTSLRFEKRSWSFYPSIAASFLWHVGSFNSLSTVTYFVSAERLAALKTEASQALKHAGSEAPCAPGWISKNDALAARVRQVVAQLSGKMATSPMHLWVNLRKRMVPPLSYPALGNCSWPVTVKTPQKTTPSSSSSSSSSLSNLGSLAAEVRTAIQTVNNQEYISQELRWLEDTFSGTAGGGGASMTPCVFKNASEILKVSGPLMLSNWDWGGSAYSDLQFGPSNPTEYRSSAPIWHQPPNAKVPNCVFVVPAAAAAAAEAPAGNAGNGGGGGGVLVHITLHKRVAEELKRICPAL